MQDFDFFPNLIKFTQVLPKFCPNWRKFCRNLPKNLLEDVAASPTPTPLVIITAMSQSWHVKIFRYP